MTHTLTLNLDDSDVSHVATWAAVAAQVYAGDVPKTAIVRAAVEYAVATADVLASQIGTQKMAERLSGPWPGKAGPFSGRARMTKFRFKLSGAPLLRLLHWVGNLSGAGYAQREINLTATALVNFGLRQLHAEDPAEVAEFFRQFLLGEAQDGRLRGRPKAAVA